MPQKINSKLINKTNELLLTTEHIFSFTEIFQKISNLETKLKTLGISLPTAPFIYSLLGKEAINSSKIEGSTLNYNELYYPEIKNNLKIISEPEIRNKREIQNLVEIYRNLFVKKEKQSIYTIFNLKKIHKDLYNFADEKLKSNLSLDHQSEIQKQVLPGTILTNEDQKNRIADKGGLTILQFILPSEKMKYLKYIFQEIDRSKKVNKTQALRMLIKFHPFFIAIHPFVDGNGRIGRLLLSHLFTHFGFMNHSWIFLSHFWKTERIEYITQLNKVMVENDWPDWIDFFLKTLEKSTERFLKQMIKIIDLYQKLFKSELNKVEKEILQRFFRYAVLNRKKTIGYVAKDFDISSQSAYRYFDKIIKLIDANKNNQSFYFDKLLDILNLKQ